VTKTQAAAPARKQSLIRSSMIYSGFTLISRLFGFARDLAITYAMGASASIAADAFNTAFAFPNLFRRIFAEGAFAAAFVPAYSKSLEQDGEEIADVLAADAMAVLAAATIVITIIAELAMPLLMRLIAPGFADEPGKYQLAVLLTRITMPYLPCMAIYAHLSGVLNARNRFILSGAAPILLNLWTLVVVLPAHSAVQASEFASAGIVAAGVSQAALLWWGVNKSGAKVTIRWPRMTPQIKALIMLAVPGALAASATQINIFVSGILASHVNGARSWLAVADRLYQLPLGLVGVAVGVALLPQLSRAVHAKDRTAAQTAMDQAVVFSMALTLPAAAAMVSIPYFLTDALYTRGLFGQVDAHQTAGALLQYGWGVPAFVLQQLFARAFFARQDTKTPMTYSMISVATNIAFGITLYNLVGVQGIAAATSLASWVNVVLMVVTLARRDHYQPSLAATSKLIRALAASAILGGLLALTAWFRPTLQGALGWIHLGAIGPKEVLIGLIVVLAGCVYPVLLFATGGLTPAEMRTALRRKGATPQSPADLP
jgi:putative peptidoglycan lipid II flippase